MKKYIVAAFIAVAIAACSNPGEDNSSVGVPSPKSTSVVAEDHPDYMGRDTWESIGGVWPLIVEGGIVGCPKPSAAVIQVGSTQYALNEIAEAQGYRDISPIRNTKTSIGQFRDFVLAVCSSKGYP